MSTEIEYKNDLYKVYKIDKFSTSPVWHIRDDKDSDFWISISPTCNCQISSIGQCDSIINNPKFHDIIVSLHEQEYVANQLLIDIVNDSDYKDIIKEKFDIVFQQDYRSSNGSDMTMFLVKLGEEDPDYDEDYDEDYDDDY